MAISTKTWLVIGNDKNITTKSFLSVYCSSITRDETSHFCIHAVFLYRVLCKVFPDIVLTHMPLFHAGRHLYKINI